MSGELSFQFLGTSASVPTPQRNVAGNLLVRDGQRYLIDCGEGTQRQMMRYRGLKAPNAIFITHYHPDHILGLPGLLATLNMGEDKPGTITVYGPPGIEGLQKLCIAARAGRKHAAFEEVRAGDRINLSRDLHVLPFTTEHGCSSNGYLFREKDRAGHFDIERAARFGIEPGPDFGRLQRGETVNGATLDDVLGPERPGRRVAVTGDTRPCEATIAAAQDADLLVHEATFGADAADRAKRVKHSTIDEAISVGVVAGVERLALTHFSPRTSVPKTVSDRLLMAWDGDIIDIPMN